MTAKPIEDIVKALKEIVEKNGPNYLAICCIIKIPKVADKNGESCISILEKIAG